MTTSTQHAQEVLQRLRKRRTTPACYPYFKRKVRCEGGRPCQPCAQRGHPEICHDEDGPQKHPKVKSNAPPKAPVQESTPVDSRAPRVDAPRNPSPSAPTQESSGRRVTGSTTGSVEPQVGRFSAISFVRYKLNATQPKIQEDVRAGIGLGNANVKQPSVTSVGQTTQTTDIAPRREEVLRYFQAFRQSVMLLYPIVFDAAGLETKIFKILSAGADATKPAQTGVVLACLALGAQFAEDVVGSRHDIS